MGLDSLMNFRQSHWLVALMIFVPLSAAVMFIYFLSDRNMVQPLSQPQLVGTLIMLSSLPAFILASLLYLHRETHTLIKTLRATSPTQACENLFSRVNYLGRFSIVAILAATGYGVSQNEFLFRALLDGENLTLLDYVLLVGNTLLWACIGLVLAWRIPVSLQLMRFGSALAVDLYRSGTSHPIANLAAKDVLLVAGSMAFMPLQSLDAEFRWANYAAGLTVGIPAALALLVIPLLGLRKSTSEHKQDRLHEINQRIEQMDHNDLAQLELALAHADRIKHLSNWPFNMKLVTKLLGYAVIAPIAWVGAALVENLVDNLAG